MQRKNLNIDGDFFLLLLFKLPKAERKKDLGKEGVRAERYLRSYPCLCGCVNMYASRHPGG